MNKTDFLEKLKKGLAPISGNERQSVLDYYDEMISDRIENGKTEEDAVAEPVSYTHLTLPTTPYV